MNNSGGVRAECAIDDPCPLAGRKLSTLWRRVLPHFVSGARNLVYVITAGLLVGMTRVVLLISPRFALSLAPSLPLDYCPNYEWFCWGMAQCHQERSVRGAGHGPSITSLAIFVSSFPYRIRIDGIRREWLGSTQRAKMARIVMGSAHPDNGLFS